METIIPGTDMDQLGNNIDPLFSFSQFDLDLQQQAQAAIQQQQQQQPQQPQLQQQPQRNVQELWQDFDRYLPIDCQSFVMTEPTTSTSPLPDTSTSYSPLSNDMSKLHFEPTTGTMPITTSLIHSPWSPQDTVKQEYYSSPGHHSDTSSPLLHAELMPSLSSTLQPNISNTNAAETVTTPVTSQPLLPLTTTPDIAEIIAGINWNFPVSPSTQADSNKVPIHRLKPATDIQTSPSSSTSLTGGVGKQKKTAHNAIERRYRNNINDRITELKNAVPALLHAKLKEKSGRTTTIGSNSSKRNNGMMDEDDDDIGADDDDGEEYLDGVAVATKLNKATILHKATEYIHHLKRTNNDKKLENDALQHLLAQLPGGQQILTHYQVQKLQREQVMQQQIALERQWMKQDQQNRKKAAAAASKRKRANRRQLTYSNNDDFFDNASLSSDHPNTPPSDHETGIANNNRIFMALFMAIAFFSSSPLTTSAGSEQVNNHNHVSRTASEEQLILGASTLNTTDSFATSQQHTLKNGYTSWIPWMDIWSVLRLIIFIVCMIQLLSPYIKTWIFGRSFKIRRVRSATKSRRLLRNVHHTDEKSKNIHVNSNTKAPEQPPSISPGDEKCIRMTQLLAHSIHVDHNGTSVTLSHKNNKFKFLLSLTKELVLFMARHVFGYTIIDCIQDEDDDDYDDDDDWQQQIIISRWKHAFKWVKLNECECLGGNPFLSRLGLIYHSVRMLNLVDALLDGGYDIDDLQQQHQLLSMRSRAYATATMQISLGLPFAYFANRIANYLWKMAVNDANEQDIWASLTDDDGDDDQQNSNDMAILSTTPAWIETLGVIRNQMPSAVAASRSSTKNAADLTLSAYAPTLVPTAILSNLQLLDRLTLDFQTLIDNMMTTTTTQNPTDKQQPNAPSSSLFSIDSHSVKDDTTRVANWFTCVGSTVKALWQGDTVQAEQGMVALIQQVPRAMTVPVPRRALKKKERQSELDAMAKQQVIHMLAGATLVLAKQDSAAGIKELDIGEQFRLQRTKRAAALHVMTNELEATHVEGRIMALAEFAVMLVTLKAWIAACPSLDNSNNNNNNGDGMSLMVEEDEMKDTQVRLVSLSLRRMVCRPALAGRFKTQQVMIDRLDKLGRYVEETAYDELDDNDHPMNSTNGCSDDDDTFTDNGDKEQSGEIKQDRLTNHIHKMMAIIQGN